MTEKLLLRIKCEKLLNLDSRSKSDPFAIIWLLPHGNLKKTKIGVTEVIQDNLNPEFVKLI